MKPYKKQVALLLQVIPEVAKETCFALSGGTAINFFLREMPRLSVDIDLIYVPIEDRMTSLQHVSQALKRIQNRIEKRIPGIKIVHQQTTAKLYITRNDVQVKLEVNPTVRGTLHPPQERPLCNTAQVAFDAFCAIPVVSEGQLYGGKICAALDRQHPRDLFDVQYLLNNTGISTDIKEGLLLCLLSSKKPLHELIDPKLKDQRLAMINQFEGMSPDPFSYADYEQTRHQLIQAVRGAFSIADNHFLLNIKQSTPNWTFYDFSRFPAVQWKLINLKTLKTNNSNKHKEQYRLLKAILQGEKYEKTH